MNHARRIAIIGPSSSGKSTLAHALSQHFCLPLLHLDLIAHHYGSNWKRVSDEEFVEKHAEFIKQDAWVIEGNYSICMPERFARADTVIWIDPPLGGCIIRFLLRCLGFGTRVGGLPGSSKEFSWKLISYTLNNYPKNKLRYEEFLAKAPHVTLIKIKNFRDVVDIINEPQSVLDRT